MAEHGGFDHNAQALRVVTLLERRYARYDGLDLTWETLEGLVKHNGPLRGPRASHPLHSYIEAFDRLFPLQLESFPGLEAQCAALADDIAYCSHDADDGLRAGLFGLDEMASVPFIASLLSEIEALHSALEAPRVFHELTRRLITRFVEDAIGESTRRLAAAAPRSAEEARRATTPLIAFSEPSTKALAELKRFLFANMYRHPRVLGVWDEARAAISFLFPTLVADPSLMPPEWARLAAQGQDSGAGGRGLHRRHDGPLCARRISQAFGKPRAGSSAGVTSRQLRLRGTSRRFCFCTAERRDRRAPFLRAYCNPASASSLAP